LTAGDRIVVPFNMDQTRMPGWGVDRDPATRPGVPMERPPAMIGAAAPPAQPAPEPVVKTVSRDGMPPVFGTSIPPRGLSSVLRRAAYEIPDHKPRHWMLLLFADRIDVWEGRLADLGPRRLAALVAGLGALVTIGLARRAPR
jgi:hypothetical protein